MANALIGHTGFVGGNLARQTQFTDYFNSRNIESIAGKQYRTIVCAGTPAQKWIANRDPVSDRANIQRLIGALDKVRAERLILISTVDVYPDPFEVSEDSPINSAAQQPYGRHRRELEQFVLARFASLIVRLPALFGAGLKKNVIYDFLHDNGVDKIHGQALFQFYALDNLWRDIETALRYDLTLVNFATEPIAVHEVAAETFGMKFANCPPTPPAHYDFRSKYDYVYHGAGGYLYTREQVLNALREFVNTERRKQGAACHF